MKRIFLKTPIIGALRIAQLITCLFMAGDPVGDWADSMLNLLAFYGIGTVIVLICEVIIKKYGFEGIVVERRK